MSLLLDCGSGSPMTVESFSAPSLQHLAQGPTYLRLMEALRIPFKSWRRPRQTWSSLPNYYPAYPVAEPCRNLGLLFGFHPQASCLFLILCLLTLSSVSSRVLLTWRAILVQAGPWADSWFSPYPRMWPSKVGRHSTVG